MKKCVLWLSLLFAGCTPLNSMTWAQFQAFGDVTLGDPERSGRTLRIPAELHQKAGDSISVLSYRSDISDDTIYVTALRAPMSSTADDARDVIVVKLPARALKRYNMVYKSPDGTLRPMGHVDVPETPPSRTAGETSSFVR